MKKMMYLKLVHDSLEQLILDNLVKVAISLAATLNQIAHELLPFLLGAANLVVSRSEEPSSMKCHAWPVQRATSNAPYKLPFRRLHGPCCAVLPNRRRLTIQSQVWAPTHPHQRVGYSRSTARWRESEAQRSTADEQEPTVKIPIVTECGVCS